MDTVFRISVTKYDISFEVSRLGRIFDVSLVSKRLD